ncbi:MAG: GTPase Era [bacterium]|nr:GTPase Era [bacterium]
MDKSSPNKAGFIAIVGRPNVGKSTLLNKLIGEKLSAVTPKSQTTRHKILGILNGENLQAIFLDTPGLMTKPKDRLDEMMLNSTSETLRDADLILWIVEPYEVEAMPVQLKESNKEAIVIINKIDLVDKLSLLPLIDGYQKTYNLTEIIPISSKKGYGCDILLEDICQKLPEQSFFYEDDIVSIQTERFFVEELIMEKIYFLYRDEVPYSATVQVEEFKERAKGKDYIRAIIYIERDSQKAILIGEDGRGLRRLGEAARKELERTRGRPLYLELYIKTKKNWRKNEGLLREFGY